MFMRADTAHVGVSEGNAELYLAHLHAQFDALPEDEQFTVAQIQDAVDEANAEAENESKSMFACPVCDFHQITHILLQESTVLQAIADCASHDDADQLLELLRSASQLLELPELRDDAGERYMQAIRAHEGVSYPSLCSCCSNLMCFRS